MGKFKIQILKNEDAEKYNLIMNGEAHLTINSNF